MKNPKNQKNEPKTTTTPKKAEINANIIYQTSEAIIKSILDKIISLSVRKSQSQKIDNLFGDFCFKKLQKQMTSLFETNFINYTDDLPKNEKNLQWELISPPDNTWVELSEPICQKMDRYESYLIQYQNLKKDEDNNIDSNKKKEPIKENKIKDVKNIKDNKNKKKETKPLAHIIEEESHSEINLSDKEVIIKNDEIPEYSRIEDDNSKSIMSVSAELKNEIDVVDIFKDDKNNNNNNNNNKVISMENEIISNDNKDNNKNNTTPKKNNNDNEMQNTKSKKLQIVNYPSYDIPNIFEEYNHDDLAPENVVYLRKEREELLIKKQKEKKIKEETVKAVKKVEENDKVPKKLIDTNKLTFDSNGEIIRFRPYRLDSLTKDFLTTRNTIKTNSMDRRSSAFGKKKNSTLNNNSKIKKDEKIEEIIKNDEEEKRNKEVKSILENNTEKFIPSGSNFQIISPNIGVVIKESGLFKEGPRDFSKYFKKYSLEDYDKMLNDLIPLQHRNMLKTKFAEQNQKVNTSVDINPKSKFSNNNVTNPNNTINNTEVFNNPLLQGEEQSISFIEKENNSNTNKNISNTPLRQSVNTLNININTPLIGTSSNLNSMNFNKNIDSYNSLNFDSSIVMKKMGTTLKLELDSMKDLSMINPNYVKNQNLRYNILGNFKKKNFKYMTNSNEKNVFSEFNKRIMSNTRWGNDLSSNKNENKDNSSNLVYARHHTKQQVLRELGSSILNGVKVKLPRDRKVDLNPNI